MRISSLLLNLYPLYYKLIFFFGILPLIVYPFSIYFWTKSKYETYNHGPLYSFDDGLNQCQELTGKPGRLALIMEETFFSTVTYVIFITLIIGFIQFISKEFKNSLKYFKIILNYLLLGLLQFIILSWMFN